ncbi:MAG TPA: acetolactate synthase large subunit [Gammaproteobacteria bacterium]|nr:acetolactate synthase large subunit [Candidatus Hydrogenedentota bacterium]HJP36949.1 acetolactate synthase large subunit [Gammaproteobacteria bacterium]
MTGAESLLQTALDAGVDTCFANPGTTEMDLVAALDTTEGARTILGLFEGVVTGMADGYARMTGRPAMTLLHLGVGLGNGIANIHNARRAQSAMINLVGDHPGEHLPYNAPLTSDIATMAKPVSRWVRTSESTNAIAADMAEAIVTTTGPPGKIATLITPSDVMRDPCATGPAALPSAPSTPVDGAAVERCVEALRGDEPVALLLGGQAVHAEGLVAAHRVAHAAGCSVLSDCFPGRLDRGAGLPPVERVPYFPEMILKRLNDFRYLILAGARAPVSFFKYKEYPSSVVPEGCEVIELASTAVNPVPSLETLAEALGAAAGAHDRVELKVPPKPSGELTSRTCGQTIAATLPEHAIIADESATSGGSTYYLTQTCAPHCLMALTGGGIGWGLPAATGAAVACPGRPVLALQGDGGGMYTPQALWTQAREGLEVTNVVFSNRKYQILQVELGRAGIDKPGPMATSLTELNNPPIDWAGLAKSLGVPSFKPASAGELYGQLQTAYEEPGPHLIEVEL